MIQGLGIDLLAVRRFSALEDKEAFCRSVFTAAETGLVGRAPDRDRCAALLFALKEAALKALGCGLYFGSFWRNIDIGRDSSMRTGGAIEQMAAKKAVGKIHNSAACTGKHALCIVLLESND
ncbi:4'-phosphopantetheinyl transferase superfamily protein [candidate division WOR-3 bacterium]|nr:4'-phosphopantetheinyl transferase superfamily protein [candidate division WOR-3 bacterium]